MEDFKFFSLNGEVDSNMEKKVTDIVLKNMNNNEDDFTRPKLVFLINSSGPYDTRKSN